MRSLHRLPRTRRIASVMLFVWLFATAAGWAHACLLHPSAAMAATGVTDEPDPAGQVCASFCEMEQGLLAKGQPSKGDGGAGADWALPWVRDGWPAFTSGRTEPRWRPLVAPLPPGPPVPIAFLRLTR